MSKKKGSEYNSVKDPYQFGGIKKFSFEEENILNYELDVFAIVDQEDEGRGGPGPYDALRTF